MAATKHAAAAASAAPVFLNRELSHLDLIHRVLDLAGDPNELLLERVKFCGIVSAILDEFFMVRVAGLQDQVISGASIRTADGRTPQQTLDEIRDRVHELTTSRRPRPASPRARACAASSDGRRVPLSHV